MGSLSKLQRGEQKRYWVTNYSKDMTADKIILLFDMDAFEVQVHQKPWMIGLPRVVVNSMNRIVAVSHEAKLLGINRSDTPYFAQAQKVWRDVIRIEIPSRANGRPQTGIALRESAKIIQAIKSYLAEYYPSATFQFASNDEFYVDITSIVDKLVATSRGDLREQLRNFWPNTFIYNDVSEDVRNFESFPHRLRRIPRNEYWNDFNPREQQELRLLLGSTIANRIVRDVKKTTTYQSSVGIGLNKLMAKIASGVNKPGSITIVAPSGFWKFTRQVSLTKIPGLGGGIGQAIIDAFPNGKSSIARLQRIKKQRLAYIINQFNPDIDATGRALEFKNAAFGLCSDPVIAASCYKSSAVERIFRGDQQYCSNAGEFCQVIGEHCEEMKDKLDFERSANGRWPQELKLSIKFCNQPSFSTRIWMGERCGLSYIKKQFLRRIQGLNPQCRLDSIKISAVF